MARASYQKLSGVRIGGPKTTPKKVKRVTKVRLSPSPASPPFIPSIIKPVRPLLTPKYPVF